MRNFAEIFDFQFFVLSLLLLCVACVCLYIFERRDAKLQEARNISEIMWDIFIHALYPLPVILLVLMSVPVPESIKARYRLYVLAATDFVLFYNPWSPYVSVFSISTTISVLSFLMTALQTHRANLTKDVKEKQDMFLSQSRCFRWRAERNFWMCLLSVVLWLCLYRIRVLMKECEILRPQDLLKEGNDGKISNNNEPKKKTK